MQVELSVQAEQPDGQAVQLVAPAIEKDPAAQLAHAAVPPAENSPAAHWTQVLELRPNPESQV